MANGNGARGWAIARTVLAISVVLVTFVLSIGAAWDNIKDNEKAINYHETETHKTEAGSAEIDKEEIHNALKEHIKKAEGEFVREKVLSITIKSYEKELTSIKEGLVRIETYLMTWEPTDRRGGDPGK